MSSKLQELTEKLYNEGLSKGKEEGEQLLARARSEAESIVADARKQAEEIVAAAGKQADDLREKTASDVKMASAQCLQATKKDIEDLLVGAISADSINKALSDPDFLKKIITAVAERFSTSESADLALILPTSLQQELEPWVAGALAQALGSAPKAHFSKKVAGGFSIGPKDGSWFVSLTDETFRELIAEYLRPVTRKLLFG
jgi:V/A-type H+-transporting ATPase subunit E